MNEPTTPSRTRDEAWEPIYQAAYDQARAEMWRSANDMGEISRRVYDARRWMNANQAAAFAADNWAGQGRFDGMHDAAETLMDLMPSVSAWVILQEARDEATRLAADVTAVHAAIAKDDTIPAEDRLRILAGLRVNDLVEPGPVRPDCPPFCRSVHRERPDEITIHRGEEFKVESVPRVDGARYSVSVVLEATDRESEQVVYIGPGDIELDAEAAYRFGVQVIRRALTLRPRGGRAELRAMRTTLATEPGA